MRAGRPPAPPVVKCSRCGERPAIASGCATWKGPVCDVCSYLPSPVLRLPHSSLERAARPDLLSVCPKCGALVEDLDGFGVLAHLAPGGCGYCSHFDVYGDVCRVCEAVIDCVGPRQLAWFAGICPMDNDVYPDECCDEPDECRAYAERKKATPDDSPRPEDAN